MSSNEPLDLERIHQLMVDAATQGLSPQDEAELSAALSRDPSLRFEAEAYEMAATEVEMAMAKLDRSEALPGSLREKLLADAGEHVSAAGAGSAAGQPALKLSGTAADKDDQPTKFSLTDGRMFGWYAAAAALIALLVVLSQQPSGTSTAPSNAQPTLAEQFDALASEADTVTAAWGFNADGGDPAYANTTGEVIWNGKTQTGYMKLAGLPINDPRKQQYQLWIVDGSRDVAIENTNRIDGGVFDVTAQGEVIVPIDAKLLARDAAAFAITVESPGGVVESKGPLQVVALVDAG